MSMNTVQKKAKLLELKKVLEEVEKLIVIRMKDLHRKEDVQFYKVVIESPRSAIKKAKPKSPGYDRLMRATLQMEARISRRVCFYLLNRKDKLRLQIASLESQLAADEAELSATEGAQCEI